MRVCTISLSEIAAAQRCRGLSCDGIDLAAGSLGEPGACFIRARVQRGHVEALAAFMGGQDAIRQHGLMGERTDDLNQPAPSNADNEAGSTSQGGSRAAAWDDGIDALHDDAAPAADPETEELRAYWRERPENWAAMHKSTRWALLQEMGLREL